MKSAKEVLMLKRLSFEYSGPMVWWESYGFYLKVTEEKVYFTSSPAKGKKEHTWRFEGVEVPYSVIEELSEIARAAGAVGTPAWVDPLHVALDAHTYHYDLYWTDGTLTGPGKAANQIMSYLNVLAIWCAEEMKSTRTVFAPPPWMDIQALEQLNSSTANAQTPSALIAAVVKNSCDSKWKGYHFKLEAKDGETRFDASCYSAGNPVSFLGTSVPNTVMIDIANAAKAAGNLGNGACSPAQLSPKPENGFFGADRTVPLIWHYSLLWEGHRETGLGEAREEIVKYLHALVEKCLVEAEEARMLKLKADNPGKDMWSCPDCGFTENFTKYCVECGQPRP